VVRKIVIYGAGIAGRLLSEQISNEGRYTIVAFVDDDPLRCGDEIAGVKIHSSASLGQLLKVNSVSKVIVSIPSLSKLGQSAIIERLEELGANAVFFPTHTQIIEGKFDVDQSSFSSLIGRKASVSKISRQELYNKNILVTGGGGSIGSEICAQLLLSKPKTLFILDHSEFNLFKVSQSARSIETDVKYVLADYGDRRVVRGILDEYKIDYVFHAGAYKHVTLVENNIFSSIENNIFGTLRLFGELVEHDNGRECQIVVISTDKAVNPTSVMGATKRFVELICRLFYLKYRHNIVTVRFGNVFGSSGSVIPIFVNQIKNGGPITVTDPAVERYFMSIPEAVNLVILSSLISKPGGAYFLDMGDPVNILELAKRLIRSFGLKPSFESSEKLKVDDIQIIFTGLKQGEKISEELSHSTHFRKTKYSEILQCEDEISVAFEIELLLDALSTAQKSGNSEQVLQLFKNPLVNYSP